MTNDMYLTFLSEYHNQATTGTFLKSGLVVGPLLCTVRVYP